MSEQIVIDAKDAVLGRTASYAAKQALLGKSVIVVNCTDALVTGNRNLIIKRYSQMRARGKGAQKGPIIPKVPEKLMKRIIRGMLSYSKGRGEAAFDRIRCHNAVPKEFESAKKISLARELRVNSIKLSEIAKII